MRKLTLLVSSPSGPIEPAAVHLMKPDTDTHLSRGEVHFGSLFQSVAGILHPAGLNYGSQDPLTGKSSTSEQSFSRVDFVSDPWARRATWKDVHPSTSKEGFTR